MQKQNMSNKNMVVYTAIFGGYDGLLPQTRKKGVDYVCFTDRPLKSKSWKIVQTEPSFQDPVRCARMFKVNPHKFLPEYERSIWIDGNYLVRGRLVSWAQELLDQKPVWVFDHNQCPADKRNCVYLEHQAIVEMFKESGHKKDDLVVMEQQMRKYKQAGYPEDNGLIFSAVVLREHHHPEVIKTMELWWEEIKNGSRRDQLSFNYAAWKNKLDFGIVNGDLRRHKYFFQIGIHRPDYKGKYFRYRLKRIFGLV